MRIGVVVPGGVDPSGTRAVVPCLVWLLERLTLEHDVVVFSLHQGPEPGRWPLAGATVLNIGRGSTSARTLAVIVREHRRSPFDVLHAFWAVPGGAIAGMAGKLLRRPVLLHLAGGELAAIPDIRYGDMRTAAGRAKVRLALGLADLVTAPSGPVRAAAAALGRVAVALPLGVDLRAWPPRPPRRRTPGEPARLIHVASLNRVKDQLTLLRAMALLAERGVSFELDVVGEDTLGGETQRTARDLGLAGRIAFHGFLPQSRLRTRLEAADLLVLSSRHEAGPVVLLEAACAGVPAVGTAVGLFADWAPHAAAAVPVRDPATLAGAVQRVLADEDRRLAMAAAAQRLALAFDADRTAAEVQELYRRLIRRGAPAP